MRGEIFPVWPRPGERRTPEFNFAAMTVEAKRGINLIQGRLIHPVFGIPWQFRSHQARERPASPRPPAALLAAWFVHPIGIVLEMNPRIANENVRRRMADEPHHRGIREQ